MKTFKQFFRYAALAVVAIFASTACTTDTTDGFDWLDQPFAFDISYSTGEAVWDEENPETLVLNKLGIGMTGTVPYLKVKSNTYWTISVPEECNWLRLSLRAEDSFADSRTTVGGPSSEVVKTDDQITNVYLKLLENKGETHSVELVFTFSSGLKYKVPIAQRGALSTEDSSLLTFLKDSFGVVDGDDTRIKFYPFSMSVRNPDGSETSKRTYEGIACAGDATGRPFSYAGSDNVFVSDNDPSGEYTILTESNEIPASGGANIRLNGKGYFDVRVFNNQGKSDFQMFFGAKNEDGRYREKDLKVWVSKDGVSWTVDANASSDGSIAYEHLTPQSVNGWAVSKAKFSVVPGVSDILYFRFENTSSDTYRIDDILFEEYEGETDQIFSLIQMGSDVIGLPVNFEFTNLKDSNTKGMYWRSSAIILSNQSGVYDEASEEDQVIPTVPESTSSSAHVQFMTGSDMSLVKTRTDSEGLNGCGLTVTSSAPKVIGFMKDDYWIWTLPVHKVTASTNVKAAFTFKETDAGPKYFYFEWAQCTEEEYAFAKKNILLFSEEEKREFYATLDWKVAETTTIDVPNDVDKHDPKYSGIPTGSAKSPASYWTGQITYSTGFAGIKGGADVNKEISCNFPEAMEDGYFFFRLRCAADLTTGACDKTQYQRINRATHNGTSYLTKQAVFTFDGCGQKAEYDNQFRLLPSYAEFDVAGSDNRVDLMPKYIAGDNAVGAVYAGTSANIPVTTQGNNLLNGSCENDETGASVYFYSPYSSSSSESASDVILSVPSMQIFDNGYLVSNSVPVTSDAEIAFKTTNTMRAKASVKSAVLELDLYTGKLLSGNMSKIEVSTVNPDDPNAEATNIAGSYHYDLLTNTRGEAVALSKTITSNAVTALTVPASKRDALKLYFGLWEGTHKLYLKVYAGPVYYVIPVEAAEYKIGTVTAHEIKVDDYPYYSASDQLTGIANAEQFRQFCQDVKDGKTGSALDQYRNIDGELGFGGAVRDEDKVIDMAGVNIYEWPLCTLHENFNGGNYVIKNLVISNKGRDLSENSSIALFQAIDHGCTISNITFDESCKLDLDIDDRNDLNFAFLMVGGKSTPIGSFYNIVNYGTMDFSSERGIYNTNAGAIVASACGAKDDTSIQSTMVACKNYGKIYIHDVSQSKPGSRAYNGYVQIGGIMGINLGMIVEDCENHGEFVLDNNVNREIGTFYFGGIAGYNTNRTDNNSSILFGILRNCRNYGPINVGQNSDITVFNVGISGIVGRMQWAHLDGCSNFADIKAKARISDPHTKTFTNDTYNVTYPTWVDSITASAVFPDGKTKGTTNSLAYFSIGGIFSFVQNNITTGTSFSSLTNSGNIDVEVVMDGTITYADNSGVSVGGIAGRTGANAYNPHFDGCTNMGNITLKANAASAEAFVGGICGIFVGNRYTNAYIPYCHGSSNNGTITFKTDNPADVVAHAGGICGAALYGNISTCVNAGIVNNASTNEKSHTGSILGTQHRSTITPKAERTPALTLDANAVGGSVNGVTLNKDNFADYTYGGYETYELNIPTDSDGKNTNYFYNM